MIPLKEQDLLKQRFARDLHSRVRMDFYGQKPTSVFIPGRIDHSGACEDIRKLMHELASLNPRINLATHDIDDEAADAQAAGVQWAPAIVLRGATNRPIRYYGNPRIKQFLAFVEALILVAHGKPNLQSETVKTLRKLRSDVALRVFVAPACAYSPLAVVTTLQMALESPRVRLDIVDISTFPEMIAPFSVRATPLTVFNDQYGIPGVIEEGNIANDVLTAAQGNEPAMGGDPRRLTPVATPESRQQQSQQGPRTTPSGLIVPR